VPDRLEIGAESLCCSSWVSLGRSVKINLLRLCNQVTVRLLSGGRAA
jgi:hypothetical protein